MGFVGAGRVWRNSCKRTETGIKFIHLAFKAAIRRGYPTDFSITFRKSCKWAEESDPIRRFGFKSRVRRGYRKSFSPKLVSGFRSLHGIRARVRGFEGGSTTAKRRGGDMAKMHQRTKSSQLLGMEEGAGLIRSSSSELGRESSSSSNSSSDSVNMALLIMLYAMQGVPLGLSLGSIPFILKSRATYTEVGVFSLAGYPYSMKLLWSPIVDTIFSARFGWRKSWVLPMQMTSGLLMLFSAQTADHWLETADIHSISTLFFVFILLAATQDIAVDGWALTLLSRKNVGHASTCQTIGINIGYFMSFTIFLALNDPSFCNNYLRSVPKPKGILTLSKYFYFWGWFYIITTILLLYKSETPQHNTQIMSTSPGHSRSDFYDPAEVADENRPGRDSLFSLVGSSDDRVAGSIQKLGVKRMYKRLWAVVTLPNIRLLTTILLISKLGSITAEAVGVFKLMEKGVTREVVSLVVLIEFPLELIFAVFAGRWASKGRPFTPWLTGYYLRLGMAAVSTLLVALFPAGATLRSAPFFYFLIILSGVITSFASTMMFVAQGTFFSRISDSSMGGTYLTLLNTIANFGSAWPKFFVFILLDMLTVQHCASAKVEDGSAALSCTTKKGSNSPCTDAGGSCITTLDGFYPLSFGMVIVGAVIGQLCSRKLRVLEMSKEAAWRA